MNRAVLILVSKAIREKAKLWIDKAPSGTRVEFREAKRTIPQNDRMYAMITDVSKQVLHLGHRYTVDEWKVLFLHALGQEVKLLPALDGNAIVPYGYHSSDLSKGEMSDLMTLIEAWGAEHGVIFHDYEPAAGDASSSRGSPSPSAAASPTERGAPSKVTP